MKNDALLSYLVRINKHLRIIYNIARQNFKTLKFYTKYNLTV